MDNGDNGEMAMAKSQCDYFAIIRCYCCCCSLGFYWPLLATSATTMRQASFLFRPGQVARQAPPIRLPLLCACWHYIVVAVVADPAYSWLLLLLLPDLSAILKVIKIARKSLTSGTNTRSSATRSSPPAYSVATPPPPPTHHICLFSELLKKQQQQQH